MKKIYLFLILLVSGYSVFSQTIALTAAPTEVANGGTVTVTVSGENSLRYVNSIVYLSTMTTTSSPGSSYGNFLQLSDLNKTQNYDFGQGKTTKFSFKMNNTYAVNITCTLYFRLLLTNQNEVTVSVDLTVKPDAPASYPNVAMSREFTKNNCGPGQQGTKVTYNVPAGKYTANTQQAADQLATNDLNNNGQANANTVGECKTIYYSAAVSGTFYSNACGEYGGASGAVTFTVPASKYSSIVSQQDANNLAAADLGTNGQIYADSNGPCSSAFKIQLQSANAVGDNATATLVFRDAAPSGATYEFQLYLPDGSTLSASSARNLYRFTISQSGSYQLLARTVAGGVESPWLPLSFSF